jgi:hypothetical protein
MRSWLTRLITAGVAVLAIVGTVDALRDSPFRSKPALRNPYLAPSPAPAAQASVRPPRCTRGQLALRIENLNGTPALELAHVAGEPCRTPRLPIQVGLLDRAGRALESNQDGLTVQQTVGIRRAFAPTTLAPQVAVSALFSPYVYLCGTPKPAWAFAEAGSYSARGRLPHGYATCLDDLGP